MKLSRKAKRFALQIWSEQLTAGIGEPGEIADLSRIDEWVLNRTYSRNVLEDAVGGNVAAIAEVRREAGLSVFV